MALDDLKATIETLRERIRDHSEYLKGYETRTRQALIDPMLRALGWDVEDPKSVELEYKVNQDRLDYALGGSERPIAVIEAKALGKSLDEKETMQVLNYANSAGIPYMALTNGDHWRMLEVFKQAPIEKRVLMEFCLSQDAPYACALQALRLWRPNLASGKPQEATTPVMIKPSPKDSGSTTPEPSSEKKVVEPSNNGDWIPLTSLKIEKGQKPPPNAEIKFPDSSTKPIKHWGDLLAGVAQYLVETNRISDDNCPVHKTGLKRYLVHTEPIHATGTRFNNKRKIGKLWLNTDYTAIEILKHARWLLENFNIDPATVLVTPNPS